MILNLPRELEDALAPLFEALPLEQAMPELCPTRPTWEAVYEVAEKVAANPVLSPPELLAGLWLYVDDLDRSHTISQALHTRTGSLWHAIMHRREGDFSNSGYWLHQAAGHPVLEQYDARGLLDQVNRKHMENPKELIEAQRSEWTLLFEWCAREVVT
jgi:hypothetical protein